MSWGAAISNLSGIVDKWMKGRRGRVRRQLENLKKKKKRIVSRPPTKNQVKRIEQVQKKIKELESYLKEY